MWRNVLGRSETAARDRRERASAERALAIELRVADFAQHAGCSRNLSRSWPKREVDAVSERVDMQPVGQLPSCSFPSPFCHRVPRLL
jgi:hypothetical protein